MHGYCFNMCAQQSVFFLAISALLREVSNAALSADNYTHNLGIIGGHTVSIHDAPFMAALYFKPFDGEYRVFCGGSVIHERFVLTAGHCLHVIDTMTNATKRVLVGTDRLSSGGLFIDVEAQFIHDDLVLTNFSVVNDICLMKLKKAVPFSCKMAKVEMPGEDFELDEGTEVNVTGWGYSKTKEISMENELRQATVPIVSKECCRKDYLDINDNQICAGSKGHDACQGDSGGPLTYNGVQIGVVSFGERCGVNPGVYTSVSKYLGWINSVIEENL